MPGSRAAEIGDDDVCVKLLVKHEVRIDRDHRWQLDI